VDILPSVSTDHSAVKLTLKSFVKQNSGPSFWRFNNSLLKDVDYIEAIHDKIAEWKHKWHIDNDPDQNNCRLWWEYFKYKIRNFIILFSKRKTRENRKNIHNLEKEISKLESNLVLESNQRKYNELKEQLEKHYERITEGIIIRSRCQVYEQGGKIINTFWDWKRKINRKAVFVS
jgi:hypothetical protein